MSNSLTPNQLAIQESLKARIISRPNPWVGAVIVPHGFQDDPAKWIRGHTQRYKGDHAEICAINNAGDLTVNATLYVTLEPCNHFGNTPPCTEAIIAAGITKVVVGIIDPDHRVSGSGIQKLLEAGIKVELFSDADRESIIEILLPYLWHKKTQTPFILLKTAVTADGKTATSTGDSKWISSEASRKFVHYTRAAADAIVVGASTVKNDDPELTVRYGYETELLNQPMRIVFGGVPEGSKIEPCIKFSGDIKNFLNEFKMYDFQLVMVEGGSKVAAEFMSSGLVNMIMLFMAPKIYGGNDAFSIFSGSGPKYIKDLQKGSFGTVELIGGDIKINYYTEDTVEFINSISEITRNVIADT